MIRSIFSWLFGASIAFITFVVTPLVLGVFVTAILLGIGTLLTRVFDVTVFEATLILTFVSIPIMVLILRLLGFLNISIEPELYEEPPEPPSVTERWIQVPRGTARRGKRR